jgi:hypothetical protein
VAADRIGLLDRYANRKILDLKKRVTVDGQLVSVAK